jgi:hypothetical protein
MILDNFLFYTMFGGKKMYFGILDHLYYGQKVVMWFSGGQEFLFLCCPLPPDLSSP